MKFKVMAVIALTLGLLVVLVINNSKESSPENKDSLEVMAEQPEKPFSPDPIQLPEISDLLLEWETGKQVVEEESLFLAAQEKSARGYYSNLILAERAENENNDVSFYYRDALALYSTNDVRLQLAAQLLENEKKEEAVLEYLSLLPDETAFETLDDINVSPERISRVLVEKSEWKAAEEYLQPLIESTAADTVLKKHYAIALAQQGEYKKALPFLQSIYETDQTDTGMAWWYGRALEAERQTTKAMEVYASIGEKGAYRLGIIHQNRGSLMEAAEIFSTSNEPASLWRAARIWDEEGMLDKAIATYTQVAETQSAYQDDAAYRAYVLSNRLGRSDTKALMDVMTQYPAWRVRVGMEPVMPEFSDVTYEKPEFLSRVDLYEEEGYIETAAIELAIGSKNTSLEEKLALGDWYQEKGDYYRAIIWGNQSLIEKPTKRGYELAYPFAFEEIVNTASKDYNVEAALILAVMREESHFRHEVISRAGAMGLMQIMPATGKDIASRLSMSIENNDLLKPEISIKFGAFYISSMLNMFDRDMDKAMAAYNGGPGNVNKWLTSRLGTTKEDFPTAIPFFETQEYITKVKNAYHIYRSLYMP